MSRKTHKNTISPFLSGNGDAREGRFIQVGNSLLLSERFTGELKHSSVVLYLCLCMEAGGRREVCFTHGTAKKYHLSPATYDRGIKELINAGFIERVYKTNNRFDKAIFRLSTIWKTRSPP